ncbi:FKBP-type peptidyl-prolyl cis-trans isomerase 8, partial [Piptocephalis cylindrospora]
VRLSLLAIASIGLWTITSLSEGVDALKEAPTSLVIGTKKRVNCKRPATKGDKLDMHYTGTLFDTGKKFDSSHDRNTPLSFTLGVGQVIKGWDQGILGMCPGEQRKLQIPPELAYGERGSPPVIPANAALVFEIELIKIR